MAQKEGYTPLLSEVRKAYRAHFQEKDNPRYIERGQVPMTAEQIDAEFDRFIARLEKDTRESVIHQKH